MIIYILNCLCNFSTLPGQTRKILALRPIVDEWLFYEIIDHGMDLELSSFVRDFSLLVANNGKSRILKKKKYFMYLPPKPRVSFFLFILFYRGIRIYDGIFCNNDIDKE